MEAQGRGLTEVGFKASHFAGEGARATSSRISYPCPASSFTILLTKAFASPKSIRVWSM
jgi:hypothetical protein